MLTSSLGDVAEMLASVQRAAAAAKLTTPTQDMAPQDTSSDFLAKNKTALLVGGGAIVAGVIGFVIYKKNKKRK